MSVRTGTPEPIAALNRVKILEYSLPWEAREPLVDIRVHCPDVVCNAGICPYLRKPVADMLNQAQSSLPSGYRLKVGTALRTLSMQKRGWDGYHQRMRTEHPDWPLSALRRATNKYHAPYDQKAPPGHCTGSAVDVGLLDPAGNALDMIAPTKGWEAADTFSDRLSPEAKANRMLMVEAMLGAGFSNCRDEYWHYSWGDSAWAVRIGETTCPYGWTYPPVTLETDFEGAHAADLSVEFTRDRDGKVISAHGRCAFPPATNPAMNSATNDAGTTPDDPPLLSHVLSLGIYWAKEIPVSLRVTHIPAELSDHSFWIGDGKETWEPLTSFAHEPDGLRLHIEPPFDRTVLTTQNPISVETAPLG